MANLPTTVTYQQVFELASYLAGRTPDNVPEKEATLLQAVWAAELPDLWRKEAWPELCDNLMSVPLANNAFSLTQNGTLLGDVLAVFNADPRTGAPGWKRYAPGRVTQGNNQMYVLPDCSGATSVWVDWQLPPPDLLDSSLVGQANQAALAAVTLPERFRLPLAYRGAARLLETEDPALAAKYAGMAETELARQVARLTNPWWRQQVKA